MFQNDMDVYMLQDEIVSCSKNCFIIGSLSLKSFMSNYVMLSFSGLCFEWVLVVYVSVD
jgi:hypothetical protein